RRARHTYEEGMGKSNTLARCAKVASVQSSPGQVAAEILSLCNAMIITSLLDTDLYKFTMMQVVLHHSPGAHAEYRYKCRTPGVNLVKYLDEIRDESSALCKLQFTREELQYLRGLRF